MNVTLEFFDFQAAVYDAYQGRCVPKYEEMISVTADFLTHMYAQSQSIEILDVGCGTGNTTRAISRLFPKARFSCIDGSENMITIAGQKLADLSVEFHHLDIGADAWNRTWTEQTFDAVTSVLVLEHLPFHVYRQFLRAVQKVMNPGAWLVAVEGYAGEVNQRVYFEKMRLLEQQAISERIITKDQLEAMKKISAEKESHYFAEPEEKKSWWVESGLTEVSTIWQFYCVGAMVGRKPI